MKARTFLMLLSMVILATAVQAVEPTWSYDADWVYPNSGGFPFATESIHPAAVRELVSEDGVNYLHVDTISSGDPAASVNWKTDWTADGAWRVDDTVGYSVEWRVRPADPCAEMGHGAAALSVRGANYRPYFYLYREAGLGYDVSFTWKGTTTNYIRVGKGITWHTYRLDAKPGGECDVYVDDYPWPIFTGQASAMAPTDPCFIMMGDVSSGNGIYDIDFLRTYQDGVLPAPTKPEPTDAANTLLVAHFDGSLVADLAVGDANPVGQGAEPNAPAKFGTASANITGILSYSTADNFNVEAGTIEMWIKPDNWNDMGWQGLFGCRTQAPSGSYADIRIQKTNHPRLQAYMNDGMGHSYSVTTGSNLILNDGQWYHIAWTWDLGARKSALYVDGQVVQGNPSVGSTMEYSGPIASTMFVGNMQTGSNPFYGCIDEFRISDKDLYGGQAFTPQGEPWADGYCGDATHPLPDGDVTGDCVVDLDDVATVAANWLTDNRPE